MHFLFFFLMWCVVWVGIICCCKKTKNIRRRKKILTVSSTLLSEITSFTFCLGDYLYRQTYYFSEKQNKEKFFFSPYWATTSTDYISCCISPRSATQLQHCQKKLNRTKKIITIQYIITQKLWQGGKSWKTKKSSKIFAIYSSGSSKPNLIQFFSFTQCIGDSQEKVLFFFFLWNFLLHLFSW